MTGVLSLPLPLAFLMIADVEVLAPAVIELPRGGAAALPARVAPLPETSPGQAAGAHAPNGAPAALRPTRAGPALLPPISSGFGQRSDPIHGRRRMHYGIDIPGRRGTQVVASEAGVIRFAGVAGGYGRMVEIAHGGDLATRYGHLDRILVTPGMQVARGQPIGLMGASGRATGSHLHFELRANGRPLNPLHHIGRPLPHPGAPVERSPVVVEAPHQSRFARARAAARQPEESGS